MQHLLLLHGAIGAKDQLMPLADELSGDYTVHLLNFAGHGGEPMPESEFSIPLFATQVLNYLEANHIDAVSLFGYSMGGYVALYLAAHYPERARRVITLATKFHWDETTASREVKMLDPQKIEMKVPVFVKELQRRHTAEAWQTVLKKTAGLLTVLGQNKSLSTEDMASIAIPVLVLLGDRDKMVTLEETVTVFKQLQHGSLGILPATAHPIEQVNIKRLVFEINQFMN